MFGIGKKKESHVLDYSQLHTDMHSHLLPGVDDGAADLNASVQMIRGLMQLGYKKFITTPHILWDMYQNTRDDLLRLHEVFIKDLEQEGITAEILLAAEYFVDDHLKTLLEKREPLLTLHENLVLVEFSLAHEPLELKDVLFEMQMQGYQPVIAHPERYVYNIRNKEFFEILKYGGYLFQLNILALAGAYGKEVHDLARYFIKSDYYDLAGTDLHQARHIELLQHPSITTELKPLIDSGKLMNRNL
jgi:tyrosine-protein phosphatase YwqE